jgi:hypothetical protein
MAVNLLTPRDGAAHSLCPLSMAGVRSDRGLVGTGNRQPCEWRMLYHLVPPRQVEAARDLGAAASPEMSGVLADLGNCSIDKLGHLV